MSASIFMLYADVYDTNENRNLGFVHDEQKAREICKNLNDELIKKWEEMRAYEQARMDWMHHNKHRLIPTNWFENNHTPPDVKKLIVYCFENNISVFDYNQSIKAEFTLNKPEYDESIKFYSYDEIQEYTVKV